MAFTKVTVTLDGPTVAKLADSAERLSKPKSAVIREAIADYHARLGRLGEEERLRMLATFDRVVPAIPARPLAEVEAEIQAIRRARRSGGRRTTTKGCS